jgi:Cof subfamily protein (haloacid dehalogenase superfamily)
MAPHPIRLLLAGVNGTLVDRDQVLTRRTIAAVGKLRQAGILFAVTSGRPPRGMSMLVEPLELSTPISAFNGGLIARADMSVIEQKVIPDDVAPGAIELLASRGMSVWVYRGPDWFALDANGPHVAREAWIVRFDPTPVESFTPVSDGVAKLVGVSDDRGAVQRAAAAARGRFGRRVSASISQPCCIEVTHPDANKGSVVRYLSRAYDIPLEQIATIGDMPDDMLMFAHSGLSIAMGNASHEVRRAAHHVTATNEDDGFASAVERFILPAPS